MEVLLLAVLAATISLAATPAARRLALRLGAVDEPDARRVHATPTPRLGGLAVATAIFGAIAVGAAVGAPLTLLSLGEGARTWSLLAGALVMVAAGALDDVRGTAPATKLVAQIVAAALAVAGGHWIAGVTNPFTGAYVALGGVGALLAVVWIVAITNAFNLIDGLDGLAAGVGLIGAGTLLVIAWIEGRADVLPLWAVLVGALAGFLVHNFAPASIFLGDSGSLLVGYLIALLALQGLEKSATVVVVLSSVLALGLPIVDMALAIVRRTRASGPRGIVRADRAHLHHRLVDDGTMSHRRAVLVLYGVAVAGGAVAIVAALTQSVLNTALVVAAAAACVILVRGRTRR
ncbi:MAG: undecaprenyl/decaprenyl-phosphate alpha-N-acetylglucosaminyl 1-phosphate transferase [bacterium]|nr:undecaprenyl/decaprenyl-phosphate alpha-N-acetylglucosaminyl 1-phosphate transferase [bacterium]